MAAGNQHIQADESLASRPATAARSTNCKRPEIHRQEFGGNVICGFGKSCSKRTGFYRTTGDEKTGNRQSANVGKHRELPKTPIFDPRQIGIEKRPFLAQHPSMLEFLR